MGTGFQVDVLNLTGQSIYVSCSTTDKSSSNYLFFTAGGIPLTALGAGQYLSQVNSQKAPQYFEASAASGCGPMAIFIGIDAQGMTPIFIEFSTTTTQLFDGIVYRTSSSCFALPGGLTVCPAVYLTSWGKWTEAIVVLLTHRRDSVSTG